MAFERFAVLTALLPALGAVTSACHSSAEVTQRPAAAATDEAPVTTDTTVATEPGGDAGVTTTVPTTMPPTGSADEGTPQSPSPPAASPATTSWTFAAASDYVYDDTRVVLSSGATLVARSQTDADDITAGFAGGVKTSVAWSATDGLLQLQRSPQALPDGSSATGWLDMTGNVLLLHVNEAAAADNGAIADASASASSGTLATGDGTASKSVAGVVGGALAFDGVDDVVTLPTTGISAGAQDRSIAAWIYPLGEGGTILAVNATGGAAFIFESTYSAGYWYFFSDGTANNVAVTQGYPPLGRWSHLALTMTAAGDYKVYVNGVSVTTGTFSGGIVVGAPVSVTLGARTDVTSYRYHGSIDELAMWNRVLSDAEVAALHDAQAPARSGSFVSRIFDAGADTTWTSLAWTPAAPYGKQLPANGVAETGYAQDNLSTAGAQLLLHFDEAALANGTTLADRSGQGNDGAVVTASSDLAVAGRLGKAIALGGSDYVELGDTLSFGSTSAVTVSVWVKTSATGSDQSILSRMTNASPFAGYDFGTAGGMPAFWLVKDWGTSNAFNVTAPAIIADGTWHHVAYTYDGSSSRAGVAIYVDGAAYPVVPGTTDSLSGTITPSANAQVGRRGGASPGNYFTGALDELAVFGRVLSPAEVSNLYQRTAVRLRFKVRSCAAACTTEPFIGPDGTGGTDYSELASSAVGTPTLALTNVATNRYFQYEVLFDADALTSSSPPRLARVAVGPTHYDGASPSITSKAGVAFSKLTGFGETLGAGNQGTTSYQLSNDGTHWYWFDGAAWTAATTAGESNPAAIVDANAATFAASVGGGSLRVRAFLRSPGAAVPVVLEAVSASYLP